MSFYGARNNPASERGQRTRTSQRKDSTDRYEANANGNNNSDVSRGIDSYISNYTRSAGGSHRSGTSRASGGLRTKSNLVGSMTATFEQLKVKDSLPPSGSSGLKSPCYSRSEALPIAGQRITNTTKLENGTDYSQRANKPLRANDDDSPKYENGIDRKKDEVDDDDSERTPSQRSAKPSSSARRGKQQREKRMLRQKRRSTGVVKLKDSDDEKEGKPTEKPQNSDEKENETNRKLETEKNTLSNETSPPQSANDIKAEVENKNRTYDSGDSLTVKQQSTSSSSLLSPTQPDSVFLSGDSAPQSPNVPSLNSSRRRGKRTSDLSQQDSKEEIEDLRRKLTAAEATIGNLTKEIQEMETDIKQLAEENHNLKHENKLLEDENTSMLMVLKQLRNNRE